MSVISWLEGKKMRKVKDLPKQRTIEEINQQYTNCVTQIGDLESKQRMNDAILETLYQESARLIEEGKDLRETEAKEKAEQKSE